MYSRSIHAIPVALLLALAMMAQGCKDQGVEPDHTMQNLQLSVQASASVLHKTDHETLHITSVKVLIKSVVFSRAGSVDSTDVHSEPIAVNLNLDAVMTPVAVGHIKPGVYDRVRFTIHKPEDNEMLPDSTFRQGSSGNQRFSVVITGLYHDTPFTFTSRESAYQELLLARAVTVTDDGNANVTLKIDPYAWFTVDGLVLDPFNQEKQIDDRVKGGFGSAFKDDDRNGEPD
jgi:hypothetical protein